MLSFLQNTRKCKLIHAERKIISGCLEMWRESWKDYKGHEELLEMINIVIILVVGVISWVYTYVKTYQIIRFTYVQFIVCQLNFSRAVQK